MNVIIMGAAGRDFFNFSRLFRDSKEHNVVCFTAEQIPNIANRRYPKELAGKNYPKGIPICPESGLPSLIKKYNVDQVFLSYSDLSHEDVMHKASLVNSLGADFVLPGTRSMLESRKLVIAVCAVRTGCGKSQTVRAVTGILKKLKLRTVVVRHPMPYGDLKKQAIQRFAKTPDMDSNECTIEEREEYEQHIRNGVVVYAGIDYEGILKAAEKEADVIVWDGGNNDTPFFRPDLHIVMADPLRPGHEKRYYPGETNVRMADVVIIGKENSADREDIASVTENVRRMNNRAKIVHADSLISVENPEAARGKRILVVEDGPTITHGGMGSGAGYAAAKELGGEIVDPREFASGSIKEAYKKFPHMGKVLPALGYGKRQIGELEKTINGTPCDLVLIATPMRLGELIRINKPCLHVTYDLKIKNADLKNIIRKYLKT